jgi:hypothetical protein
MSYAPGTFHHRHSLSDALDPADYTYVSEFYSGISNEVAKVFAAEHAYLAAFFGTEDWEALVRWGRARKTDGFERGSCVLCGAAFAYGSVFRHVPSGEFIAVGHICAENYLAYEDKNKKNREKKVRHALKREENERKKAEASAKFDGYLAANPEFAAAIVAAAGHDIVEDIVGKCRAYRGEPSEPMAALVIKIANEKVERDAARAAEPTFDPVPVPEFTGRPRIEGEVVWEGMKDNSVYGATHKMVVRVTPTPTTAYKLYGTVPSDISAVSKGDKVAFNARVEPGDRDPDFGFFSRPTKPEIIEELAELSV